MKYLKILGLAAVSAMAFMAFASTASATTLEVEGTTKSGSVTITASLATESTAVLENTSGSIQNVCTGSHVHGYTTVFTGTYVTGPATGHLHAEKTEGVLPTAGLSFSGCTRRVTVHDPGTLKVDWTGGTNGTVWSEEAEVTSEIPFFGYANCQTGESTHIGDLTGVSTGHATLHVNAVLNCGALLPSARWTATYTVTSPNGLGVQN